MLMLSSEEKKMFCSLYFFCTQANVISLIGNIQVRN